ncbi:MAG: hypothetical protein IT430_17760 [Phycisphaerales bacterium]|nr:hypothetical protein [Phycisphaerales bacterium]
MKERPRAYFWCYLAAIAMLLLGFASMVGMVTRTGEIIPPSTLGGVLILLSVTLPLCFILFVLPIVESGHGSLTAGRSPRRLRNGITGAVWLPLIILVTVEGLVLSGRLAQTGLVQDEQTEQMLRAWWLPAGILMAGAYAVIYTIVVNRRIEEVAQREGLCLHCGYKLAEIPNCQRCPECGTEVSV